MKFAFLAAAVGALLSLSVPAQDGSARIPAIVAGGPDARRLPDYSYAGYGFGVAPIPVVQGTVVEAAAFGAKADDALDDTKAIQRAIAHAATIAGPVTLRLPAGRLIVSDVLRIERSDFRLVGAGSGAKGTELHFPRSLKIVDKSADLDELRRYMVSQDKRQVEPANNIDNYFSEYSWSGGFIRVGPKGVRHEPYLPEFDRKAERLARVVTGKQGSRQITVDRASSLNVGDIVQVLWYPDKGRDSGIIRSLYGNTDLAIGSHHWTFPNRPTVAQATRIVALDGNVATLGDPLLHDVGPAIPSVVARWEHITRVGIEDIRLSFPDAPAYAHHLEQGFNGIYLGGLFDGWVRNVAIDNADSGILTYNSASVTISHVITRGWRSAHYAVHVGNAHNVLVRDLIVDNPVVHPLSVNTQSTRAVHQRALVTRNAVFDQHSGANHENLFDDVRFIVEAKREDGRPVYDLWDGGGAPYWQPGHGRYNTFWNVEVVVASGAEEGESVLMRGATEGPDGRVIGLWGNRPLAIDYRPAPYVESLNRRPDIPSLYDYQLARRTGR